MVAFTASGEVTKEDFETVVYPAVENVVKRENELNYLMVIDTDLKNFTMGAWLKDALLGLKKLTKWNRVAILSDSSMLNKFTDIFSVLVPGEFKGFDSSQYHQAVNWVSQKGEVT